MLDWFLETGIYLTGIAAVPFIGLALVCWGLWGDRSRGRARCPQCLYDMRGSLPKLECPECGHDARHARRLYRNHRGPRRIVLGVMLFIVSAYPLVILGGWLRDQSSVSRFPRGLWDGRVRLVRTGPAWLQTRLPEGFARLFDRADSFYLGSATDADLAECGKMRYLRMLDLYYSPQVTDRGLQHLEGLQRLEHLCITAPQATGAALSSLRQALPNAEISTPPIAQGHIHSPDDWANAHPRLHWPPPGSPQP